MRQIKVLHKLPKNRYVGYALLFLGWLLLSAVMVLPLIGLFLGGSLGESFPVVSALALLPAFILCMVLTNQGRKRLAQDAAIQIKQDPRPPIIYLRPFEEDGKINILAPKRSNKTSFNIWQLNTYEERLAFALRKLGPLIAIGKPHEELPTLGAARMYVNDSDWHGEVTKLMSKAALVLFRVGHSESLLWELQQAVAIVPPERLILCFPELRKQDSYFVFYLESLLIFPCLLPTDIGNADFLYFDNEWRPHLISANNSNRLLKTFPTDVELMNTQQLALKHLCSELTNSGSAGCIYVIGGYIFLALILLALYYSSRL